MRLAAVAAATSAATLGLSAVPAGAVPFVFGNEYTQTNLVSDLPGVAQLQDPHLQNAWGLATPPNGPVWVSDNNGVNPGSPENVTTVYSGGVNGSPVSGPLLDVTIPGGRTSTGDSSSPTGQVWNPTSDFTVTSSSGSGPASFIFDSESGQISAWNSTADPIGAGGVSTATLESSSPTAVYKGLAEATGPNGPDLFATNFHDGTVDVFNGSFQPVSPSPGMFQFRDPAIPRGFAPFGIQAFPGNVPLLYVTYALQDAAKHDSVARPGAGFIDVYTTSGQLVDHFARARKLNAPWGIAIAPTGFGPFAGDVIVGNFGDGRIDVFNPFGRFLGQMRDSTGQPITIDGLWGLLPGDTTVGGTGNLIFSAGPNDENDGLLGTLSPASTSSTAGA
ncbi:MAG: TIGR03118 family protein [Acidimicrobiaceae bacterium]|nr:TIGR03118 family protein [Acidimicrobiaceae bacterium]